MVRPEEITGFMNNRWFSSLGELGGWLTTIVISIICLITLYLLWNYLEHRIKLCIFPVYGATDDVIKSAIKSKNGIAELKSNPNVQIGMPKRKVGKRVKYKGVRKFQILKNPFKWKKINDINYEYEYPDGIWLLEPKKDIYIPIERPKISNPINIKVPENDVEFWMQLENEEQLQRTRDETEAKRQVYMTIAIIIGAFILAGIIIWLSMSFAGNTINTALSKMDAVTQTFQNIMETKGPG